MTLELVPWRGAMVPDLRGLGDVSRFTQQDYLNWLQDPRWMGPPMPFTSYGSRPAEPISATFEGFVQGMLYADGPVASAEAYRLRVFGQAPLLYQEMVDGRTGDFFDDEVLERLRSPWPGGTLSDLAKRALTYGDFAGNAFVVDMDDELVLVRPDWVEIVLAKREFRGGQVGWKQIGIVYYEGGPRLGDGVSFLPGEYAHFVPGLPDPLATYRGMSWLTPLVREVQADKAATDHKVAFFENAASPNLAVSLPKEITPTQFEEFVDKMDAKHKGAVNAYKTLYTAGGADVTVIGANMQQMDFSAVQGKGETRVANAAGVPPVLLSFSEGMQGSSLNAGNYTAAKRNFVDTTMRDLWANWAGSVQQMEAFAPPRKASRLWYYSHDIPFLNEDARDRADIFHTAVMSLEAGMRAGFKPDPMVEATKAQDLGLLVGEHTGLFSVQMQPPTAGTEAGLGAGGEPAEPVDFGALREPLRAVAYVGDEDDVVRALVDAFDEIERRYNPHQARIPRGFEGGGRFRSLTERLVSLLSDWAKGDGPDDPLDDFDREQLRKTAKALADKARGAGDNDRAARLTPRRGASSDEIKLALYKDVRGSVRGDRDAKAAKSPDAGKPVRFTLTGGSADPAKVREIEVDNRIRAAYAALLARKPNQRNRWVMLSDLRDELGESTNRHEIDAALIRMGRGDYDGPGHPIVVPESNQKSLTPADREAAVHFGGQDKHAIAFDDPSPRPAPKSEGKLRDLDVTVHTESNGKISLWETSDSGERRRRVALVDDLAGLEAWADDNGETQLADWARKERGGGANSDDLDEFHTGALADLARENDISVPYPPRESDRAEILQKLRSAGITRLPEDAKPTGPTAEQKAAHEAFLMDTLRQGSEGSGWTETSTMTGRAGERNRAIAELRQRGLIRREGGIYALTPAGRTALADWARQERGGPSGTKVAVGDDALKAAPLSMLSNIERPRGVNSPNATERAAFDEYGSNGQAINARLRRGGRITAPIAAMDAAMSRSPLSADVELWRGVPGASDVPGLDLSKDATGAGFTDRAFVSTSVNPKVAERFAQLPGSGPSTVLRLRVSRGTGAVAFSGAGGISESQGELLLQRDLTFRVTKDHGVSGGLRRLDVEVAPASSPKSEPLFDPSVHAPREAKVKATADALGKLRSESDILAHLDEAALSRPELDALGKRLGIDVSGARSERAKAERIAAGLAGGKAPTKSAKKAAPERPTSALTEDLKTVPMSGLVTMAVTLDIDLDRPRTRSKIGVYKARLTPEEMGDRPKTRTELVNDINKHLAANPDDFAKIQDALGGPRLKPRKAATIGTGAVGSGSRDIEFVPARLGAGRDQQLRWREGTDPGWSPERERAAARALRDYSGASYVTNFYLRGTLDEEPDPQIVKNIHALDDLMSASKLDTDVKAYRGLRSGPEFFEVAPEEFDQSLVGREWVDPAYGSTSTRRIVSLNYATQGADGVLMRLMVPSGTGVAQVQDRGTDLQPNKAEMLLERGIRYKVVADQGRNSGSGYRVLDVVAIPPQRPASLPDQPPHDRVESASSAATERRLASALREANTPTAARTALAEARGDVEARAALDGLDEDQLHALANLTGANVVGVTHAADIMTQRIVDHRRWQARQTGEQWADDATRVSSPFERVDAASLASGIDLGDSSGLLAEVQNLLDGDTSAHSWLGRNPTPAKIADFLDRVAGFNNNGADAAAIREFADRVRRVRRRRLAQPTREERIKQLMLSGLTRDEAEAQLRKGVRRSADPDEVDDEPDLTDDDAPSPEEVGDEDEEFDDETLAHMHALLDDEDDDYPEAQRADLALGGERLHRYWTIGKGLRKWLGHPHPWTSLYRHLRKYVGSERAKRMAAKWVHEVTGNWPGSDAHRVATGHKPRGHRIGPG